MILFGGKKLNLNLHGNSIRYYKTKNNYIFIHISVYIYIIYIYLAGVIFHDPFSLTQNFPRSEALQRWQRDALAAHRLQWDRQSRHRARCRAQVWRLRRER